MGHFLSEVTDAAGGAEVGHLGAVECAFDDRFEGLAGGAGKFLLHAVALDLVSGVVEHHLLRGKIAAEEFPEIFEVSEDSRADGTGDG